MSYPTTYEDFRSELRWYEEAFPQGVFAEVSLALTGQEPIGDVRTAVQDALADDSDVDLNPAEQDTLERSVRLLDALRERQVTTFEMRQYRTRGGDTPADINERAAETDSVWGLAAHGASLTAKAHVAVYTLSTQRHAIVWNREYHGQSIVHVQIGPYSGGFDIAFPTDVDAYLQRNFYEDNWRRPEHLTDNDSDPWVYEEPALEQSTA